jgi:hypothetical protein
MKDRKEKCNMSYGAQVFEDAASFEASLDNKPIFTRALIEQAAEQVQRVHKGEPQKDKRLIRIPHLLGGGSTNLQIPAHASPAVHISWTATFSLAKMGGRNAGYRITPCNSIDNFTATEILKPDDPNHPLRQRIALMRDPPELEEMKSFEAMFLASRFWANLRKHLDHLTVPVENIVCVALGSLFVEDKLDGRHATQHLLACTISTYLSQRYASSSRSSSLPPSASNIPIISRDPAYTLKDIHLLSRLIPPITVVSDPYQYLSITPNTLFISISVPFFVPVHEIVADLCSPTGPAAILCKEVFEHPWHKNGLVVALDQRTPRVGRMLEKFDVQWLGRGVGGEEWDGKEILDGWAEHQFWYARKE